VHLVQVRLVLVRLIQVRLVQVSLVQVPLVVFCVRWLKLTSNSCIHTVLLIGVANIRH
jgi:hypothetical protein